MGFTSIQSNRILELFTREYNAKYHEKRIKQVKLVFCSQNRQGRFMKLFLVAYVLHRFTVCLGDALMYLYVAK